MSESSTSKAKVKSQDVADLAGVSRTTVSLVLNGRGASIPERTRIKVVKAAEQLGFVPSAAARILRSGKANVVLVLAPGWMSSERADRMWDSISKGLEDQGLTCVFSRSAGTISPLRQLLADLTPSVVASFFSLAEEDRVLLDRMNIPLVELFLPMMQGREGADTVFAQFQQRLGYAQGQYFAQAGARDVAYLGTSDPRGKELQDYRVLGVTQALGVAGLSLVCQRNVGLNDEADMDQVLHELRGHTVDAVCAFNDDYAAALLSAARRCDVNVPKDMKVLGADNLAMGRYLVPSLSSVDFSIDSSLYARAILQACDPSRASAECQMSVPNDVCLVRRESA
ncbi:LacI family DNA-binding transcriptional regulator [Bifidobacterium oedipodis]|uniref:Regulatory protein LacI family protein n=1 Tax=Bifidobacterium oedipodis TaxID=2675322 RepID=A0A7Y0EQS7_9BIFI|nr:LacI family DNA-binding transcriptional regulator [Bifidobacterium sp. DSM 109957]NMM94746.1 regulatory protein LacI family protein [Bifidobacterium sp. DSM 109957]